MQAFANGQHPFNLANLHSVRLMANSYGKRVVLDASQVIENAWYIQQHELGMSACNIATLVEEIAKTTHVIQIDHGAQDLKCPTGGLLAGH